MKRQGQTQGARRWQNHSRAERRRRRPPRRGRNLTKLLADHRWRISAVAGYPFAQFFTAVHEAERMAASMAVTPATLRQLQAVADSWGKK